MEEVKEGPANARRKCCSNCAGRNGGVWTGQSPKESAEDGEEFYCHVGAIEGDVAEVGFEWEEDGPHPRKLDGTPADMCAAWAAHSASMERREAA